MPTNTSAAGGISQRTTVWAAREMLKSQSPVVVLDRFGVVKPMPKNKGVAVKFRRPKPFTAKTTPLVEGVAPNSDLFEYEDVPATLRQYGQVSDFTDVIQDTHEDPVVQDMVGQLGKNMGRTTEALTYGILKAGTNVFYANGTGRTSVNTPITLNGQRAVTRALAAQKAEMLTKVLDGSTNLGTMPVDAGYFAVAHTDLESDLRNMAGFIPVAQYGSRKTVHPKELGACESVRYVLSPDLGSIVDAGGTKAGSGTTMVSYSGTSADVYPVLYFGEEAYGTVPLRGVDAAAPTIIPVSQISKEDPLGQVGKAGWKMWFTAVILNQLWMARLEVAVTSL